MSGPGRRSAGPASPPEPAIESYQLPQLIRDLRTYQAELESQNKVLRYSQSMAEAASERFETLFSSVPLALMVVDEHDLVVQSNSMAQRSFQPTERDRPLNFLMPFVSAASVTAVRAAFDQAREHGQAEAKEVVFAIGEHGAITGDLHIARLDNAQEPVTHFICAVIDQGPLLAERRALLQSGAELQQRNEQLRTSEARLADIINSSLDAIVCVDREHRITVFNPTAAALFQCPPAAALGSPLERFFPEAAEALAMHQISTQALLGEMRALTASGAMVPVEVSVAFGDTTTLFARDLTSRQRAEAQRSALEAQLRESQKMQAVGTMAGGIAHDFNNILHAILGNVELAKEDTGLNAPAQESLREIEKAGRRARDLVRQILTFSRNQPPKRVPTCLAEVVTETERLLRVTLPPTVELQLRIHPGVPAVLADHTQVEQALLNLCTNAIQALGEVRGTVCIELQSEDPNAARCARLGLTPGSYARLVVRDTGPGMSAATLERIFEPFFTTKEVGQGTGLGLAVVHGVMRSHAGAVDVQTQPGQGSQFSLYFPASSELAEPPPPEPPTPNTVVEGSGQHVMYVDDDQALVFLVERLLRRRGFRVSGYSDPHEATAALRADPAAYDLVVTDYNMPGYCGVDLVREARLIRPDLPVALASGYVTAEIEREAMAEGARALIHKPNDVEELCATVQRLVQGSQGQLMQALDVLHADAALLVLNKPAGLLSVPGRGPDKQDALSTRAQQQYPDALIVHRLDMATSGLMLMARGPAAQRALSMAFESRHIAKRYEAVVDGRWQLPAGDDGWGLIDLPIRLDWPRRPLSIVDPVAGKPSRTRWRLLQADGDRSRLALEPITGRSHQLRLHLAAQGHAILGDALYAREAVHQRAPRLLLHACRVELQHPVDGQSLRFESPAPF